MPPITPSPTDLPDDNVESASSSNDVHPVLVMSDSDSISDDENFDHNGYELLSQDPENCITNDIDEELNGLSDNEEPVAPDINVLNCAPLLMPVPPESLNSEQDASNAEEIELDEDRIETIKSVMKGITLPDTSLPQWASVVPEEEWKRTLFLKVNDIKLGTNANNKSCSHSKTEEFEAEF